MSTEQGAVEQPKRRGRPPGSKKTTAGQKQPEQQIIEERSTVPSADEEVASALLLGQMSSLDDEQLASRLEEETLSPFSILLRHILKQNRAEITRITRELEVAENTVYRWMNGSAVPRAVHLKRLPEVLAEHRENLVYAINQTFPGVLDPLSTSLQEVRKDIYRRVLDLVTTTTEDDARYWQVTQAIFEYALLHLDSHRQGLAITYANLMPAHADGIHSLREAAMRGNFPWSFLLESKAYLGSTTLAGAAAMFQRIQIWDNLDNEDRLQVDIDEFERSACAYPVMRAGRIAGVLIISSAQASFFSNPVACQAVVEYAQLLSLALREEDFQPLPLLSLRPMPALKWQRAEIEHSYVNRIIACARKHILSFQEAEGQVLREMELEFEALGYLQMEQQGSKTEQVQNKVKHDDIPSFG